MRYSGVTPAGGTGFRFRCSNDSDFHANMGTLNYLGTFACALDGYKAQIASPCAYCARV
jgi:hypothetical protein